MTEIFFIRHGETDSNIQGLLHGRTDVPLTELGRLQATQVARRLAELGAFDAIYTSPLERAATTAEAIARELGLNALVLPDLTEFDFGDFEGISLDELQDKHPHLIVRIADLSDDDFRFPRGESRREFHARVLEVTTDLIAKHERERIVVVAHGGVIGSAVAQLSGGDANDWSRYLVHNCSITHLEFDGHEVRQLHCWNDVAHLDAIGDLGGTG